MDEKANLNDHLNQHVWPKVNARAVTSLTTYLMPKLSDELVEDVSCNHTSLLQSLIYAISLRTMLPIESCVYVW
eukprot:1391108-Amorphochlora_amoeboformis.AAC.1